MSLRKRAERIISSPVLGNNKIFNFKISEANSQFIGLFSKNYGDIIALGIEDFEFDLELTSISYPYFSALDGPNGLYIGGLIGYNNGYISRCFSNGTIETTGNAFNGYSSSGTVRIGGLIGYSKGNIENCFSDVDILTYKNTYITTALTCYVGGLVGVFYGNKLENCYTLGDIDLRINNEAFINSCKVYAGGIISCIESKNVSISGCLATGNVSSNTSENSGVRCAGGIVSIISNSSTTTIHSSYRYIDQIINGDTIEETGMICRLYQLNDSDFYLGWLHWPSDFWDASELDFENYKLPKLK